MNGFSAQSNKSPGIIQRISNSAQSIADRVNNIEIPGNGHGHGTNPDDPTSIFKAILTGINKLVTRLAPDQRLARIPVSQLAVGSAIPTDQIGFQNTTYNSICGTCRGLGATIDVYLNQPNATGFPDYQFIGGSGTSQFFFPSMPITQLTIVNSGVAVANGNVDLMQY